MHASGNARLEFGRPTPRRVIANVLALSSSELDSTSNETRARAQRSGARARNRIGGTVMADQIFDHERLDVYRLSIDYVGGTFAVAATLSRLHRHSRDQ
jgi:hypothetical protein